MKAAIVEQYISGGWVELVSLDENEDIACISQTILDTKDRVRLIGPDAYGDDAIVIISPSVGPIRFRSAVVWTINTRIATTPDAVD